MKKLDKDAVAEAKAAVNQAIEALETVPRTYGGHLEREESSTIDNTPREYVMHRDGRVMRFVRRVDWHDTVVETALCVYRDRWIVVPARKLRAIG